MAGLVVTLIALGTLAFGAVYPWGFLPLFAAAALVGLVGLGRGGVRPEIRPLAISMLVLWAAVVAQLLPIPRDLLDALSPQTVTILSTFSLTFASGVTDRLPLSIDPRNTQTAVLALGALSLYLIGLSGHLGGGALRRVPRGLAIFAVPLALFGILSREYGNGLVYWFWLPLNSYGASLFGPFVNRNHFAGWMLMAVCLLVGSLFGQVERALPERRQRRQRPLAWLSSAEANGILLMGAAVFVAVIALFWTLSRSAITGFAAGAAVFGWLALTRPRLGTTRRAIVLAGLGAVALAGVAWRGPAGLLRRFQDEGSLLSRMDAWRDGWQVVRDFPLTGTGVNTYSDGMLFYQTRNLDVHLAQAHNDYVQLLAEGGLLVTIPAVIAAALLARAIRRNLRAAQGESRGYWVRAGAAVGLLAVAVQEVFEFSLQMPANALLFCTLAALALTPVRATASRAESLTRDSIDLSKGHPSGALS